MSLRVLDAGLLTTVQDAGRVGWAHLGVPRAGYLDRAAATFANRLVGNPCEAALLETTLNGVAVRLERAHTVAVTGARCDVRADGRALPQDEPVTLRRGTELRVGPARSGVRSYVALAGGVDVPPVLGSRSTDTLAGVGPPPLVTDDRVPVGRPHAAPVWSPTSGRAAHEPGVLRVLPGPHLDWLQDPDRLDGARGRVGAESNRVGLRVLGADLRRRAGEVPSEGVVLGAVQLPPSGEAVVFLNDHPTTGGYPVVAVVHPDDLGWCAQARPGDEVVLRLC